MDGRDAFLTLARDKHFEFSSLRRAQFSTLCMLYELHNQGQDKFVYTCNNCKSAVETRYHCTVCDVSFIFFIYFFYFKHLAYYYVLHILILFSYRTLISALYARRKLAIHIKWRNLAWTLMMAHHQPISNKLTLKRRGNNPYNDAFSHWYTHVSVVTPIVVCLRVKR